MTPAALPWAEHLAAFEEWLRRMGAVLDGDTDVDAPLPELATVPRGALPDHLRVRAECALQALRRMEQTGRRRRAELTCGEAYARW